MLPQNGILDSTYACFSEVKESKRLACSPSEHIRIHCLCLAFPTTVDDISGSVSPVLSCPDIGWYCFTVYLEWPFQLPSFMVTSWAEVNRGLCPWETSPNISEQTFFPEQNLHLCPCPRYQATARPDLAPLVLGVQVRGCRQMRRHLPGLCCLPDIVLYSPLWSC